MPRIWRQSVLASALMVAMSVPARAGTEDTMRRYVGYTILAVLQIVGYRDANGKGGDSFEGCEFGRVIVFEGNKALTCTGYSYSYAYRPTAVILVRGSDFKMLVDGNAYDMHN